MKKIIKTFSLFVLLIVPTLSFAQVPYQIYVYDLKTDKSFYNVGSTVIGEFFVYNGAANAQSDMYYRISSGNFSQQKTEEGAVFEYIENIQGETDKVGPLYLTAGQKQKIDFTYALPDSLSGNVTVKVEMFLKDGTPVGQNNIKLQVTGASLRENITIEYTALYIPEAKLDVPTGAGPYVYRNESISYMLGIATTTKDYIFKPKLNLYNQVDTEDSYVKTIELPEIKTSKEKMTEFEFKLPVDLEPLVYYGVISFDTEDAAILSDVKLRYIIAGPISTIRNITTDMVKVSKDQEIIFNVTYGIQPLDELRPEKQVKLEDMFIHVDIKNEKGKIIGSIEKQLDTSTNQMELSVPSNSNAKSISFESTIKNADGEILSTYNVSIPAEQQNDFKQYVWYAGFFILCSLIIGLLVKFKNKFKLNPIVFLFATGITFLPSTTEAFQLVSGNPQSGRFEVTSISSPLPPELKIYSPGEDLKLEFTAIFGDCKNVAFTLEAFIPADLYNMSLRSEAELSQYSWWTGYTGFIRNGWQVSNSRYADYCHYTWYGVKKCEHGDSYYQRNITMNYKVPTTPGFQNIYFYIRQTGNNGIKTALYKQTYCVNGAGVCPGEVDQCNNIAGVQLSLPNGTSKDASGNCRCTNGASDVTNGCSALCTTAFVDESKEYVIEAKDTGKVLEVLGNSNSSNGGSSPKEGYIQAAPFTGADNQIWKITKHTPPYVKISSKRNTTNFLLGTNNFSRPLFQFDITRRLTSQEDVLWCFVERGDDEYSMHLLRPTGSFPTYPPNSFVAASNERSPGASFPLLSTLNSTLLSIYCDVSADPSVCKLKGGGDTFNTNQLWQCDGICSLDGEPVRNELWSGNSTQLWKISTVEDRCPNIGGTQVFIPEGMSVDGDGNCTFELSCSASPNPADIPEDMVAYTATNIPGATYSWYEGSAYEPSQIIPDEISNILTQNFTQTGANSNRTVRVYKDGQYKTASCSTTLGCGPAPDDNGVCEDGIRKTYQCALNGEWEVSTTEICVPRPPVDDGTGSKISDFYFSPSIGDQTNNRCPLVLEAKDVQSCRLIRGGILYGTSYVPISPATSTISINKSAEVIVGTYQVSCVGTDNISKTYPTSRICSSNPRFGEF